METVSDPRQPYSPDPGRGPFTSVTVSVDARLRKTVRWEVRPSFQDRDGWFRVERSDKNGPWRQVGDIVDGLFLETRARPLPGPDRSSVWRVVLMGTLEEYPSEPVPEGFAPDIHDLRYAHGIYRREHMTLTRYSGIKGRVLHRRETGPLCDACTAEGSGGAPLRSNCQKCAGTGRKGGYYPSRELYVTIKGAADPARKTEGPLGTFAPGEKVAARTTVTGWLIDGDLWISESSGDRYLITAVRPEVVYRDYLITYALEMERLPFGHTEVANTPAVGRLLPRGDTPRELRPPVTHFT